MNDLLSVTCSQLSWPLEGALKGVLTYFLVPVYSLLGSRLLKQFCSIVCLHLASATHFGFVTSCFFNKVCLRQLLTLRLIECIHF